MGIDATHPDYQEFLSDWATLRDLYRGERVVKQKGQVYLPATQGMQLDGMAKSTDIGYKAYEAYKLRAVFPDYVREGVEALVGLLHQKEPTIELPVAMEPLREAATLHGESLNDLLRRINTEQLISGRIGILADLPKTPDPAKPLPYLTTYVAEAVRNWDGAEAQDRASLNLVVLDESGYVRNDEFTWELVTKYRVLQLGKLEENEQTAKYLQGTFSNAGGASNEYNAAAMQPPLLRGTALEKIPFAFINSKDIVPAPDDPPLVGLGRLVLAIYRGEADYRQNLFMQGQDTLVIVGNVRNPSADEGEDDALRTGAGSRIEVDLGGDAKYIGVSATGLAEQRVCLENDRKRAETKAGQLINAQGSQQESGAALRTRLSAQTATLNQVALAGAAGLESVLRIVAEWMGANPDEVKVTPNLEFADFELSGKDILDLTSARTMGAPLSKKSIHDLLLDRGITKLDFDTEMDTISEEDAGQPPAVTPPAGEPGTGDPAEGNLGA